MGFIRELVKETIKNRGNMGVAYSDEDVDHIVGALEVALIDKLEQLITEKEQHVRDNSRSRG